MSLTQLHLRKLLQLFYLPENRLVSALRTDIRQGLAEGDGGGDFHVPFWSDAKDFVKEGLDLHAKTAERIDKNERRERLYPQLKDGFLYWWNENRRWSNQTHEFMDNSIFGRFEVPTNGATIKVENLLSIKIGDGTNRLIYPYFSESPILPINAARIGLWIMTETFDQFGYEDMRILDVIRGQAFSISDHPLVGNEEEILLYNFGRILKLREELAKEY